MKAREIREHLRTLDGGWVDWATTVDTFKVGDPGVEVRAIGVGWMTYTESLKKAVELGCNVFVAHEPLFYSHREDDDSVYRFEAVKEKRRWLEESGLVVLRCHDLWDKVEGIGIPDSWGDFLGFHDSVIRDGWFRVYDVSGRTARDVARQVAARTTELCLPTVQLLGPADAPVTRVAIGTGAITPYTGYLDKYGVDLAICTDDGFTYWRDGALAIDMGIPAIVVNHSVSEIFGIQRLAEHLDATFPDVLVHFIPQRCMFELIAAG